MSGERDPWLTEKEAAAELRVSVWTVRAERQDGRLAFVRVRKRIFIPLSAINDYKAAALCRQNTSSQGFPARPDGTSPIPKVDVRAAIRRARQISAKLRAS